MMPWRVVHQKAIDDVIAVAAYIAHDNLGAALRFYDAAEREFDLLAEMPNAGPRVEPRIASLPELRFWPIKRYRNYLILYQPTAQGVEILRVVHGAREIVTALGE